MAEYTYAPNREAHSITLARDVRGTPLNGYGLVYDSTTKVWNISAIAAASWAGAVADTYTETYNTPARTIPAATASAITLNANLSGYTALTTFSAADESYNGDNASDFIKSVGTQLNAVNADVLALKKLIVALVQDLKAAGLIAAA